MTDWSEITPEKLAKDFECDVEFAQEALVVARVYVDLLRNAVTIDDDNELNTNRIHLAMEVALQCCGKVVAGSIVGGHMEAKAADNLVETFIKNVRDIIERYMKVYKEVLKLRKELH